jgi:arylsulfatase A-like enzyme
MRFCPYLILVLGLGATAVTCSEVPTALAGAPPIRGKSTLFSLLAFEEVRETLRSPEGAAPRVALLKPGRTDEVGEGFLPCLEVFTPATIRWDVPAAFDMASLQYALAVKANGYHGGNVHVVGTLDGEPYFDHTLSCAKGTPLADRRWFEHDAPLPDGGTLEVSFDYEGPRPKGPAVGLGLLRVGVPFEVERTTPSQDFPNVVLVVVDTLRAEGLSCYGNPRITSPRIDALAAEGTRFTHAYSAGPWTLPGTASILTGKTVPHHGLGVSNSNHLAESLDTLPKVLQRSGATTAAFTCNPLITSARNFDQGFEDFTNYRWTASPDMIGDVLQWIDEHKDERFFLYVHLIDPHFPYEPSRDSLAEFDMEMPADYKRSDLRQYMENWYGEGKPSLAAVRAINDWHLNAYDGEIWDSDRAIGQLQDRLAKHDLDDKTVIAITSDHGEEFLEHGWAGHHTQLWDESVRVPLILHGPGVPAGEVVTQPTENRHVAPTLMALGGVDSVPGLLGPNLIDAEDLAVLENAPVFLMTSKGEWADLESRTRTRLREFQSVIHEGFRLYNCPMTMDPEVPRISRLYDLSVDPDCKHDILAQHPERVERMRKLYRDWRAEGVANRPRMMPAEEQTHAILVDLGYVGEDD